MTLDLPGRLEAHWRASGLPGGGERVVVAFSGGLDSLVLLHLLRFSVPDLGLAVEAAHFDHRMRAGSGDDAAWTRGIAGAWGVPFHLGHAADPPGNAASARGLRYRFLEGLLGRDGARCVLTAHHADDQIETVLFRILRGTGIEGLEGIPAVRDGGIARPLLPFHRAELEAYARRHRIRPRADPSNRSMRYARNRIRDRLLPALEEAHPGAREGILRLARNATRTGKALGALLEPVVRRTIVERDAERVVLDRACLHSLPEPVRPEVLRNVAASLGVHLSESGTANAVAFITTVPSGARSSLSGGLRLSREFDRIVIEKDPVENPRPPDDSGTGGLVIATPDAGEGTVVVGGAVRRVRWGPGPPSERGTGTDWRWIGFEPGELAFPLVVRGWRPGDRTHTKGGTKKLKKLFGELRIPRERRHRLPLLADARGRIVWIPGRHHMAGSSGPAEGPWFVGVADADER